MTIRDAVREYVLDCEARALSPQTLRWYREKLRAFRQYADQNDVHDVHAVSSSLIRAFLRHLRQKTPSTGSNSQLSGFTLAGHDQVLRGFFGFLKAEEILDTNPMATIKRLKRPTQCIDAFSPDEVDRMLRVYAPRRTFVEHRNYVVLLCLYDTAIRLSELVGIKVEDVDLGGWTVLVHGKGRKERMVPIGKTLRRELQEYIPRREQALHEAGVKDAGYLLSATHGGPITPHVLYRRIVRAAGERAGITGKRVSPHTWRHTSALHYITAGGDAFSLQLRLGHNTMEMSRNYVNLAKGDLVTLHRRYSPVDRLDQ
jgi:integrase/recombinase XerD